MLWNSSYYAGAIEAYEREIKRAADSGITISFSRLEQFKMMLSDFKELEKKVNAFESPNHDS